ncbi:TIM-barrel domain-containing protein [Candidatus Accumulibacter phosphatis]|uniref:Maltodextrin glucosidase n=1 Tax=Candidatus Accumulibacter phosphatis TaxID=327160 RepID=A0A5S4EH64_9PROT|nr:TIM-barrel domain-containing protein [Candidatus Accumulibacter phosphatis]TMQ74627.1 Maltodextrin glucosidase [Candidatus Accumulibacter phosphatis]
MKPAKHLRVQLDSVADPKAVVAATRARFTVLTSRLLRLEFAADEHFEDRPSRTFWHRRQVVPCFEVLHDGEAVEIMTEHLHLRYDPRLGLTAHGLLVTLLESGLTWHYGDHDVGNLGGTTRTLDKTDGPIPLDPGLLSSGGWTVVDDSDAPLLEDGWIAARDQRAGRIDLYFFGYGRDFTACLHDYRRLSGAVPLLPRWALGNWWSRYWPYRQDELLDLMRDFRAHELPLSVCVIDMDWHITHTGNASRGWTGYTWNQDLFPTPRALLADLHALGLKTALNLHPADGVWPHEAAYPVMARQLGGDPATGEPVVFDITDPAFTQAYFEILHHPLEAEGVDFWWMDWQQGRRTACSDLDPLWWLNHLHFLDLGRNPARRSFAFSRWGGLGSHRYPIGFSGDTVVSWRSLAFQVHFTATAANVAFGWWSHDIGGHMEGIEDAELYVRWLQFGVFSPILRLHSTQNPFHERRPWGWDTQTLALARSAMQLRHALIPYLYSIAWQEHQGGAALLRPMYHLYPQAPEAYRCPGQYAFGSELIAAPFTSPCDRDTRLGRQLIWLPAGDWYHFFTGQHYAGAAWHSFYGGLDEIPVFAHAGAIVVLADEPAASGVNNPRALTVHVFPGADNRFELYEDDGESHGYQHGARVVTALLQQCSGATPRLRIGPSCGDLSVIPTARSFTLIFHALSVPVQALVTCDGQRLRIDSLQDQKSGRLTLSLPPTAPLSALEVTLEARQGNQQNHDDARIPTLMKLLKAFRCGSEAKRGLYVRMHEILADFDVLGAYRTALSDSQFRALLEILSGAGVHVCEDTGESFAVVWNNLDDQRIIVRWSLENRGTWDPQQRFRQEQGPAPRFAHFRLAQAASNGPCSLTLAYGTLFAVDTRRGGGAAGAAPASMP